MQCNQETIYRVWGGATTIEQDAAKSPAPHRLATLTRGKLAYHYDGAGWDQNAKSNPDIATSTLRTLFANAIHPSVMPLYTCAHNSRIAFSTENVRRTPCPHWQSTQKPTTKGAFERLLTAAVPQTQERQQARHGNMYFTTVCRQQC